VNSIASKLGFAPFREVRWAERGECYMTGPV
jgi:hypothetical protein